MNLLPITDEELPKLREVIVKSVASSGVLTPSETMLLTRAAWRYLKDKEFWNELFKVDVDLTNKKV